MKDNTTQYYDLSCYVRGIKKRERKEKLHYSFSLKKITCNENLNPKDLISSDLISEAITNYLVTNFKKISDRQINYSLDFKEELLDFDGTNTIFWEPFSSKHIKGTYSFTGDL